MTVAAVTRIAEPAEDISTLTRIPARDRQKLDAWVSESRSIARTIKELQEQREEIDKNKIAPFCEKHKITALNCSEGIVRQKYTGDRKSLSPELLLQNGVTAKVIEKSYVVKPGKYTFAISDRSEESEG